MYCDVGLTLVFVVFSSLRLCYVLSSLNMYQLLDLTWNSSRTKILPKGNTLSLLFLYLFSIDSWIMYSFI